MAAKGKSDDKPVATEFENLTSPEVTEGSHTAKVSGKLVRKETREAVEKADVIVGVKAPSGMVTKMVSTDEHGEFSAEFDASALLAASHTLDVKFGGDANHEATEAHSSLLVIDPHVLHGGLGGTTVPGSGSGAGFVPPPPYGPGPGFDCSPTSSLLAAVKRVLCDPTVSSGVSQLLREAAMKLEAAKARADAEQAKKEALHAGDRLAEEAAAKAEEEATEKGEKANHALEENVKNALSTVARAFAGRNAVAATAEPCRGTVLIEFRQHDGSKSEALSQDLLRKINLQLIDKSGNLASGTRVIEEGAIRFENVEVGEVFIALETESIAEAVLISDEYQVRHAAGVFRTFNRKVVLKGAGFAGKPIAAGGGPFHASVVRGEETIVRLNLTAKPAIVHCFSALQAESDCCQQGKGYISKIAINAMRDGHPVECETTNEAGCSEFTLSPGWYHFSAPQDVLIDGCNYTLASSSPIAAFVGAGQTCSDLFFYYKRKGNAIVVSTFVSHPEIGDPKETVTEELTGMSYLLLREGDSSFFAQRTAAGAEHVVFSGLPAGTYWLFFQAPQTFGSRPVRPVYPPGGRLTLNLFNGQANPVPVRGHFRAVPKAKPVVLDGHVRDDNGKPLFQQVVQAVNPANYVMAAALTDLNGFYSMLIYDAVELRLTVGTQQVTISRSRLQTALQAASVQAITLPTGAINGVLDDPLLVSSL